MKNLFLSLLMLSAVDAFAFGSIVFPLKNKATIEVAWLYRGIDESQVEIAWANNGQQNLFSGNICYKGQRNEVVKILEYLSSNDFLGDEYRLHSIRTVGAYEISYHVYDGPNRRVIQKNSIAQCK